MIRQSAPFQMAMVAHACPGVSCVTIRLRFARIAEWQGSVTLPMAKAKASRSRRGCYTFGVLSTVPCQEIIGSEPG
jgi:hypothetical protein